MSSPPNLEHNEEDLGFELPPPRKSSRVGVLVVAGIVVGGGFAYGYIQHGKKHDELAPAKAEGSAKVETIKPAVLTSDRALALPGIVKALEETKLYPRSSGYVKKWVVDIGDKVAAGQLLAEIETPDVEAQLLQARAQLLQARASVKQTMAQRDYSKSNAARTASLSGQNLVSQATVEQTAAQAGTDEANVAAAEANVSAMEANVRRLSELQSFSKISAPFAGTITQRAIERGALVGATGTGDPLFTLVATDPVRVFVDVPQTVATSVKSGGDAAVSVREYAGRQFPGKITRSAGSLDPELHTMSTEVQVPNPDGALLPGMYVSVALNLSVPHKVFEIPATALYSDSNGTRVATVDAHDKAKLVPIVIERDTGATLWVAGGLTGDERVVKIAVPSLVDGDAVESVAAKPPEPAAGSGSAKK